MGLAAGRCWASSRTHVTWIRTSDGISPDSSTTIKLIFDVMNTRPLLVLACMGTYMDIKSWYVPPNSRKFFFHVQVLVVCQ